jgi:pyruvate/2-oxoglutarate dehydrogenase complex dihydrolipoamide acyltransferase (E2) component
MSVVDVLLPQFGMGMTDGEVAKWHKAVGDTVTEGELLAEIEGAKATNEMAVPCSGKLVEILVPEGEQVEVRTVIARIET